MIHKNCLHYYIDLLRMEDGEERSPEQTEGCVAALHNVIRSMRAVRHDMICGEDLSRLDFGNIPLNGIHFSRDGEQPCWFDGCRMNEWSFMSGHSLAITTVAWSHNGKYILTGSWDGNAIIWDARTHLMLRKFEGKVIEKIEDAAFSYDDKYCALSSSDKKVWIWNIETDKCKHILKCHSGDIFSVRFSNDGVYCLVDSNDHHVYLWSIETEEVLYSFEGRKGVFMHDNSSCIIVDSDVIKIYNYKTKQLLSFSDELIDSVVCIDISADDKIIAAGLHHNKIAILDGSSLEILQVLNGHSDSIQSIALSPDHKLCLTASADNTAKLWDTESGNCLHTLVGHSSVVSSADFTYLDKSLLCLTGSWDCTAKIWDVKTGECIKTMDGYSAWSTSVAVSKDLNYCFASTKNRHLRIWDIASKRHFKNLKPSSLNDHSQTISSLAVSPDKHYYLMGSDDFTLWLWDSNEDNGPYILTDRFCPISKVVFSSDSNYCLYVTVDDVIIVLNCKTRDAVMKLIGHNHIVCPVSFSPDGRYILSGSFDTFAKKWDFITGKCLISFSGHSGGIISLDISSDGRLCLTGSAKPDCNAKIWNFENGKHIHTLSGHSDGIQFVKFLPDGKHCLTQSFDHTTKIWDISTGECVKTIPTSKCGEFSEATFPFSVLIGNGRIYIYQLDLNDFETVKEIGSYYNINELFIENCSFKNIDANQKVKDILYQYGGIIT